MKEEFYRAEIITEVKEYVACPNCREPAEQFAKMTPGQVFGPYYCGQCSLGFRVRVAQDGFPEIQVDDEAQFVKKLLLLDNSVPGKARHVFSVSLTKVKITAVLLGAAFLTGSIWVLMSQFTLIRN